MRTPIAFRKYSLKEKECIYPDYFEGIIEFTVDGQVLFTRGGFLTPNSFNRPQEAQEYLSLTYCPKYLYKFNPDICTAIMQDSTYELKNIYGKENVASRVWPAFGKHGGGCEVILTRGELKCPKPKHLKSGGEKDEFTQDSYMSDILFCRWLVTKIYNDWLRPHKEKDEDTLETFQGRILDGLGIIVKWIGSKTKVRYAISCAYKARNDVTDLRFWGRVWKDDGLQRYLGPSATEDLHCLLSRKLLRRHDEFYSEIYYDISNPITEVLETLLDKMIKYAHHFETYKEGPIDLPESNGLECACG